MRKLILAGIALVASFALSACGGGKSENTAGLKILHFGNGTEPQDLDPQVVTGVPENKLLNAFFEGLVTETETGTGINPGVAASWETSDDGLIWTFHLRPEAKWSNGEGLVAADFVRSYQRILTASLAAEYASNLYLLENGEAYHTGEITDFGQVGVKALDPHTLQFTLRTPIPYLLEVLKHYTWFPVPIDTIEKFGPLGQKGSRWTLPENIVGNGPYILKSWVPNQKIIADRSPTYWDRATVKLDQIHFYPIDNIDQEERMFRAGQLHKTNELPLSKIPVYAKDYPESYRQDPYYGSYFYRVNVTKPPLNDVRVRRALAMSIDRESLIENVVRGGKLPAYGFTPPSEAFVSEASVGKDVALAQKLMAEAGYPGGKGFPRIEFLTNTQDNHRIIAEAIQAMWRKNLGIDIGINNQEWKVYLDSMDTLNYDIARAGWIADYVDPNTFVEIWITGGGNNDTGWSNKTYDKLLADSFHAPTQAARYAIYQQMEKIIAAEVPIIPIYFYTRVYALSPKVKGWPVNVLDNRAWKYVDLEE